MVILYAFVHHTTRKVCNVDKFNFLVLYETISKPNQYHMMLDSFIKIIYTKIHENFFRI